MDLDLTVLVRESNSTIHAFTVFLQGVHVGDAEHGRRGGAVRVGDLPQHRAGREVFGDGEILGREIRLSDLDADDMKKRV